MLQQIIDDMYVDPDILAELSDDQKQTIYFKIREEQVRRWDQREAELEKEDKKQKKKKPKPKSGPPGKTRSVDWLLATDGAIWVWVMGEHRDDRTIEQIMEEEAVELARKKAEEEAATLRYKEEEEEKRKEREAEEALVREKTEKEATLKKKAADLKKTTQSGNTRRLSEARLAEDQKKVEDESERQLTLLRQKSTKARLQREMSYRELKEKRTGEIYQAFQHTRSLFSQSEAIKEGNKQLEETWQMRETKAKAAEKKLREFARLARQENALEKGAGPRDPGQPPLREKRMLRDAYRESALLVGSAVEAFNQAIEKKPHGNRPPRPATIADVEKWFKAEERSKYSGLHPRTKLIEDWFHGIIPRVDAEAMLETEPVGSFLVRVSDKIWGYALSYKAEEKCKHYLIDVTQFGYQFFGTKQLIHPTLSALVTSHKTKPITSVGEERLTIPVRQRVSPPDYQSLYPDMVESTSL